MRLVTTGLLLVLVVIVLIFALYNPTTVSITFWNASFPAVELWVVVVASIAVGALFAMTIALIDGTATRLENRRLRRSLRKLEAENNYLRTQPNTTERPGRATPAESVSPATARLPTSPRDAEPASAPVYGGGRDAAGDRDDDDDVYSGGSAV